MNNLFETEVRIYNGGNESLGLPPDNLWDYACIDLDKVVAIRRSKDDDDEEGNGKTWVYWSGDQFIINVPYKQFLKVWKEYNHEKQQQ